MLRSAVTVSLVSEAKGGPFVFWDDLSDACQRASELGFDGIEIFAPSPESVSPSELNRLLKLHNLALAAVGTGAGWLKHQLTLTSPEKSIRQKAFEFIRSMIDFGGRHGAPAIIGSMQGRWNENVAKSQALDWLKEALDGLSEHARQYQVPLIYEPLNRYETNLVNTIEAGVELVSKLSSVNVRLLADLFHMNIEEVNLPEAIRVGGKWIGHIHFVDSNRRPAGCGHMDYVPIFDALNSIQYKGFLSAEALAWPDSLTAAGQTIHQFRQHAGVVK